MKNNLLLLFLLLVISKSSFSQESNQVLEIFIQNNYDPQQVSRLPISNESLKEAIAYYAEDKLNGIYEKEIVYIIKTHFNYTSLKNSTLKFHNFSFMTSKRAFKKVRFAEPFFSNDQKYCIIYEVEFCRGLCGGGSLVLMEKVNGKWHQKKVLYSWIG